MQGVAKKVPVFGILERSGKYTVDIFRDVQNEILFDFAINQVKRGRLFYTDKFRIYN